MQGICHCDYIRYEIFIPTAPILLEFLDSKDFYLKRKTAGRKKGGSGARGKVRNLLRLSLVLKLPKEDTLRTIDQLDLCFSE